VDWTHVTQDRNQWRALIKTVVNLRVWSISLHHLIKTEALISTTNENIRRWSKAL
jgi:hypothetical protein